ncbi:MAG: WYL domain-containing transcriptional regulator [Clostridiales bacterium]|nr:WYL domain-containing transcriptional regulator [Clostridiales bacterium]
MGNLENTLRLLFMLKTNRIIKCKDIAKELEVNERQVRKYRNVLDSFIEIESIPGKDGGYRLKEDLYFPFKQVLTDDELFILEEFINGLDSNYLENNKELSRAIKKINFSIENKNENKESAIIPYSRVKPVDEGYKEIEEKLSESIKESNEVIIEYKGNEGKVTERRVQPYKTITYKGDKYLICFCLTKNEVRLLKLRRIIRCVCTSRKFKKTLDINTYLKEQRKNNIGIFGGKEYNLKLYIKHPMANTIQERIWVENQIIDDTKYEDGILFEAKMKGEPEILSWLLSMGEYVRILEPEELKLKYKKKLELMMKNL